VLQRIDFVALLVYLLAMPCEKSYSRGVGGRGGSAIITIFTSLCVLALQPTSLMTLQTPNSCIMPSQESFNELEVQFKHIMNQPQLSRFRCQEELNYSARQHPRQDSTTFKAVLP
jgi:hypothetical protein